MRGILFIIVSVCYLLAFDVQILFLRVFAVARVEPYLNVQVRRRSHGILSLMRFFLGISFKNHSDPAIEGTLPERFVVVSNHQSLIDILIIFDIFHQHQVRFVAKKSLGNGFPGASQSLRFQRHALIDRSGKLRQTMAALARFGRRCARKNYCPVIFPEGTRSRDGSLGDFHPAGFRMIMDAAPAPVVVVAVQGGHLVARAKDFLRYNPRKLKAKILGSLPAADKDDFKAQLGQAKSMIARQLSAWG